MNYINRFQYSPLGDGGINRYSKTLTQDVTQPAAQAMLYGIGLTDEDLAKAQVGIGTNIPSQMLQVENTTVPPSIALTTGSAMASSLTFGILRQPSLYFHS
ncbi:MAG: hypothetical protein ABI921_03470, partial [Panacibacter sp.]